MQVAERLIRVRWPDEPPDAPPWQPGTDVKPDAAAVVAWLAWLAAGVPQNHPAVDRSGLNLLPLARDPNVQLADRPELLAEDIRTFFRPLR